MSNQIRVVEVGLRADYIRRERLRQGACIIAGIFMVAIAALAFTGCLGANPAARSNHAQYGDIGRVEINGSSNTVSITVGDGVIASADGGGDMMENTPTQTTETKPEIAAAWGGASAGTGGAKPSSGIAGKALEKLMGITGGTAPSGTKLTAEEAKAITDCVGDNCEI